MNEPAIQRACDELGLSLHDLWMRYFALGGTRLPEELGSLVRSQEPSDTGDYDVLVHAINEQYMDAGRPERLPYLADKRSVGN